MPSPIPYTTYRDLITALDFGGITAEADQLLLQARVNTPAFHELLEDKVDLVIGCKGSGKTAMFKLCVDISASFFEHKKTILINGADEPKQEPVFLRYNNNFEKYDEEDFQAFWKIYFVYLLNDIIFQSPTYKESLAIAKSDLNKFKKDCNESDIPLLESHSSLVKIMHAVTSCITSIKVKKLEGGIGVDGVKASVEFGQPEFSESAEPIRSSTFVSIAALLEVVEKILEKSNLKVWIILDRLDEVFPRRSDIERKALRSLLKCIRSFETQHLRLKVFLRDDIFESVTDGGFAALTHIKDRCSARLSWDKAEIINLVLNRVLSNKLLREYFRVDLTKLDSNLQYRSGLFHLIFPSQINDQATIDWLYNMCMDGKNVVAPRDIIELLREAKRVQFHRSQLNKNDQQWLLSPEALVEGFVQMSKNKKEIYLKAEFNQLYDDIIVFEQGATEHKARSLRSLLGNDWRPKVKALESIGFLRLNKSSDSWVIPHIYRPCLDLNGT